MGQASTAADELKLAFERLKDAGVDTPLLDAQVMMARALGRSRLDVIAHPEYVLDDAQRSEFLSMLERRAARCPLAYIVGTREFFGLEIGVGPGVLVPRPETELLVEECLRRVGGESPVIADVGTGSGAIAVALATGLPAARVYATEISPPALEVARANVEKHSLAERVSVLEGDMLAPLAGLGIRFDAIVSNPPYIPSDEIPRLQPEVAVYEPVEALDGGRDGLDAYRRLFPEAVELLREGGFVAVEVGAGQAGGVRRIAESVGCARVETARDLAGIERVIAAYR